MFPIPVGVSPALLTWVLPAGGATATSATTSLIFVRLAVAAAAVGAAPILVRRLFVASS